tara:strand:+ start:2477 stop:5098 length:2622 start_codon:yes stop_codon:yes gene_type:complete
MKIKDMKGLKETSKSLLLEIPGFNVDMFSQSNLDREVAELTSQGMSRPDMLKYDKVKQGLSILIKELNITAFREKKEFRKNAVDYLFSISGETSKATEISETDKVSLELKSTIYTYGKYIKYDGKELVTAYIQSPDFNASKITIPQLKTPKGKKSVSAYQFKTRVIDSIVKPNKDKMPTLYKNLMKIYRKIIDIYKDEDSTQLNFIIEDSSLLRVFNTSFLEDFNEREKAYNHWESVHDDLNEAITQIKEIAVLLEDVDKDEGYKGGKGDIEKFIDFANNKGKKGMDLNDINYIVQIEDAEVMVPIMSERSVELLELFLEQNELLAEVINKDKLTQYDVYVGTGSEGEDLRQAAIDLPLPNEKDLEDLREAEEKAGKKKYTLDVLGTLNFERNLKGTKATFSGEVEETEEIEETIEQLKELLKGDFKSFTDLVEEDDDEIEVFIDEDINEKFKNYLEDIEEIITIDDSVKKFAPIYVLNEKELKQAYRGSDYFGKVLEVTETVDEFLLLYKNLIEGDQKSQTPRKITTGSLTGAGLPPSQDNMPKPASLFNYSRYLEGKRGTPREFETQSKQLRTKLMNKLNTINSLLYRCFSKQIFSQYLYGINLPFSKDISLKAITVNMKLSEKEKKEDPLFVLTTNFLENPEAFIEKKQIEYMNSFLSMLGKGDSLSNFNEIEKNAEPFYKAVSSIYNESALNQKIKKEIASVLGSIYQFSPSGKNKEVRRFKGIDIDKAYKEIFVDDIKDMRTLAVLGDLIRKNKDAINDDEDKIFVEELDKLLSYLDRVSKSEIHKKLLNAHDALRILKSKPIYYSMKNENSFDDINDMISKMEQSFGLDMGAGEIISIVNKVDSFGGIAEEHGITSEQVYVIKANFR